ncbi:MAG: hypothetical protein KF906_06415 [Actinobacteria bacterium]|nr:hypothetical protein [Actinomycetota bacterium]
MRGVVAVVASVLTVAGIASPATGGLGSGSPTMAVSVASVPSDRATTVTVRGTDYLVPPHDCPATDVFGGVYVMFGWVASTKGWGPSARSSTSSAGVFGSTYAYPGEGGDASIRDDGSGRVRLVSFTSGGESGAATPFHMDCDGDWETTMTIPSPLIRFVVPSTGETRTIDCRSLASGRCGIFSIGAHGKASATNERFVPITFTGSAATTTVDPGPTEGGGSVGSGGEAEVATGAEVVESVESVDGIETPGAFAEGDDAAGLPTAGGGGEVAAAAGVPGASAAPVAVAVAGGPTLSAEPTSVTNTGRVPRWLVPSAALVALGAGGATVVVRRRRGPVDGVAA